MSRRDTPESEAPLPTEFTAGDLPGEPARLGHREAVSDLEAATRAHGEVREKFLDLAEHERDEHHPEEISVPPQCHT